MLTDERLRTWLDGNQPQRERLCAAILGLDRRYTQVTLRRPRGGPDGGRDLEATFDGGARIWGAVGFRNGASDSPADKRWIRKKFSDDLGAARKENPGLDHFVFFTNVDLTPAEAGKLQVQARVAGIVLCDLFGRERLRMLLDSSEGLSLRYQYLGIEMSSAEQAAFFARFGNLSQQTLEHRFDEVDRKLARIEFHNECLRVTRYVALGVHLKRPLQSCEIGNLLLLVVAMAEQKPKPHPTLCISAIAGPDRPSPESAACFRSDVTIRSGSPPKFVLAGGQVQVFPECDRLSFGLEADGVAGFSRVADFDGLSLHLYLNQAVIDLVSSVEFVVNGYVLARSKMEELYFETAGADDEWLLHCFDEVHRKELLSTVDGPTTGADLPPFVYTNFAGTLPTRTED